MMEYIWLIPLGFMVGMSGTLIGAGGGFILVPVLLLLYPDKSPEAITSISLAVVFFNAMSGSAAYARMKRIDYKSGLLFAAAAAPGSILGSMTTSVIPRDIFDGIFGILLVALSVFLMIRTKDKCQPAETPGRKYITSSLIDKDGINYVFSYNPAAGVITSLFIGYLSSLLGIGGGIIHVPVLVRLLNFPVHVASATSHFILAIMAFSGSAVHLASGILYPSMAIIVFLAIGALTGAQLGARLSSHIGGGVIIRCIAAALGLVGIRCFLTAFHTKVFISSLILSSVMGIYLVTLLVWLMVKRLKTDKIHTNLDERSENSDAHL